MLKAVRLLLPALIPSWNFFDVIAPSPRIEYALDTGPDATPQAWREFRPRPARLSPLAMLRRLFWNSRWNETLFLVSCAERLADHPTAHSEDEILRRIAADLAHASDTAPWLWFRLVFVRREGADLVRETLFTSGPRRRTDLAAP